MATRKKTAPSRWDPIRRRLRYFAWLSGLQFSLSVTCWALQLAWMRPGRSIPWPWLAPPGLTLRAFRQVLLAAGLLETVTVVLVYCAIALLMGQGWEWGRRWDLRVWSACVALLFVLALAVEWFGVIHAGAWGYRGVAPSFRTPLGGLAVFPLLQRTLLPAVCIRLAWRLNR